MSMHYIVRIDLADCLDSRVVHAPAALMASVRWFEYLYSLRALAVKASL